ncbi:uncharacterized protein LOC144451825 [Glandiceps talaboti]
MGNGESKTIEVKGKDKPGTPPVNKRVLAAIDPRSPSTGIDRTPIQIVKNRIVVDPRSPSVDIARTPIIFEKTHHKVSVSDIRRQIQAFEKQSNISDINLSETTSIKSPDNSSESTTKTENTDTLVVEALERSIANTTLSETQGSKEEEGEENNHQMDRPSTPEGAISDDVVELETDEAVEEVKDEENESVFVETVPVAIGGLEEMNTPQYQKELSQMMERKTSLESEPGSDVDAAVMTVATETNKGLRMQKPRKSYEIGNTNRSRALMMSSPQRSPLCVISTANSPKALCRRKLSVNGSLNKTPQSPLRNKRTSIGNAGTPSRLVGVMIDKENM